MKQTLSDLRILGILSLGENDDISFILGYRETSDRDNPDLFILECEDEMIKQWSKVSSLSFLKEMSCKLWKKRFDDIYKE